MLECEFFHNYFLLFSGCLKLFFDIMHKSKFNFIFIAHFIFSANFLPLIFIKLRKKSICVFNLHIYFG